MSDWHPHLSADDISSYLDEIAPKYLWWRFPPPPAADPAQDGAFPSSFNHSDIIHTSIVSMGDPLAAEAAPPSPTTVSRRAAKGKARAVPAARPTRPSASSAGPSITRKGRKGRIATPESEGDNGDLFNIGSDAAAAEGVQGAAGGVGKRDREEEVPRVEVEGASPPHKSRKIIRVAMGEVRIYLHLVCI
jgi:hypothetical protein